MPYIAVAIAMIAGLLVLIGYFVPALSGVQSVLLNWAIILAGVATLVGVFNLISVHGDKVRRREKGSLYSAMLLISLFASFIFGLALGPQDSRMRLLVTAVIVPVEATLMALLAVTLIYASIRLLRRRFDVMSVVFLLTAVFTLIATAILPFFGVSPLADLILQIQGTLPLGGARGILIGVALGTITTGLRVLFGTDRPYGGK